MKSSTVFTVIFISAALVLSGCAKQQPAADAAKEPEPIGITYKEGKGLRIANETRRIIGLELVEASEQNLAAVISTTVQIYRQGEPNAPVGCLTGFVTEEEGRELKEGQAVMLERATSAGEKVKGTLVRLNSSTQSLLHQTEVLIQIPDPEGRYRIGTSFQATFTAAQSQQVTAIPRPAVLKTSEGTFAYVVNGTYFFRTPIKTGAESIDAVEVKEGLYAGDQIVKKPVMTLWVAELQATKGGGACD
ncbi:MAG: hypothetical protein JWR19_3937 [Pedosphaera sp.]|nr:hypothetical protein [Pedosphaera sp.]